MSFNCISTNNAQRLTVLFTVFAVTATGGNPHHGKCVFWLVLLV